MPKQRCRIIFCHIPQNPDPPNWLLLFKRQKHQRRNCQNGCFDFRILLIVFSVVRFPTYRQECRFIDAYIEIYMFYRGLLFGGQSCASFENTQTQIQAQSQEIQHTLLQQREYLTKVDGFSVPESEILKRKGKMKLGSVCLHFRRRWTDFFFVSVGLTLCVFKAFPILASLQSLQHNSDSAEVQKLMQVLWKFYVHKAEKAYLIKTAKLSK